MNVLVVMSATPHVLDPRPAYRPGRCGSTVRQGPAPGRDDACRTAHHEAARAFENTDDYFAGALPRARRDDRHRGGRLGTPAQRSSTCRRPGEPWTRVVTRGRSCASSTSRATRPSTRCSTTRTTRDRYSAANTIRAQRNLFLTTGSAC